MGTLKYRAPPPHFVSVQVDESGETESLLTSHHAEAKTSLTTTGMPASPSVGSPGGISSSSESSSGSEMREVMRQATLLALARSARRPYEPPQRQRY